jgi:uncharacterized phage protein (TIGR02220 family)
MKIKDWEKFQHYKDRDPHWVKLYRKLLDDIEWHKLSGDDAKTLVMLWLLASEELGDLPEVQEIAFRLRISETKLQQALPRLSHWLVQGDTVPLSEPEQKASLEKEKEKRRERDRERKRVVAVSASVIKYLNDRANKNYRQTDTNKEPILARLKEGYVLEDFHKAIDNQVREWGSDEKMNKFLRPSTLFQKSKFDGYVNNTQQGSGEGWNG